MSHQRKNKRLDDFSQDKNKRQQLVYEDSFNRFMERGESVEDAKQFAIEYVELRLGLPSGNFNPEIQSNTHE